MKFLLVPLDRQLKSRGQFKTVFRAVSVFVILITPLAMAISERQTGKTAYGHPTVSETTVWIWWGGFLISGLCAGIADRTKVLNIKDYFSIALWLIGTFILAPELFEWMG